MVFFLIGMSQTNTLAWELGDKTHAFGWQFIHGGGTSSVGVFKSKWDARIYELGSRNYNISCIQVTLVEVRWWCT